MTIPSVQGARGLGVSAVTMILITPLILSACGPSEPTEAQALVEVLALEDARPLDAEGRNALAAMTRADDAATRRFAVRALGRLEAPETLGSIVPLLRDEDAGVRGAAAWATAQAVHGSEGTPAVAPLLEGARAETDAEARREMARSLGRVRPQGEDAGAVVALLTEWAGDPALTAETAVGVALGLEGLTRTTGPAAADERVYQTLAALAARPSSARDDAETAARVRAVALLALGQRGRITGGQIAEALRDTEVTVRAAGARFIAAAEGAERAALEEAAMSDVAPLVRVEALRGLTTAERTPARCALLLDAAGSDAAAQPRLLALDALATPCPSAAGRSAVALLDSLAAELPDETSGWHPAAHALTALAGLAPDRARSALPRHAAHPSSFVRARAAAVAAELDDATILRTLADDPDPNVRAAALPGLFGLEGRAADERLVAALSSDDGQLLITVAGLLGGTGHGGAAPQALAAFQRVSERRRETDRDPRLALVELLSETGDPALAPRLEPYLQDYDRAVAERVATLLSAWTGETVTASPRPLERLPLPTPQDIEGMASNRVVLHMARGGEIVIQPLPFLAPTNAHRFVRLAREGYFDGLTFHRVVPAFVVQGGSPSANEYAGDGPYTRDEIGRVSHWRGTVGLSTRGRDTGDGQIFVNLADNVRLDHDYTIFGRVVSGMAVVDAVLAGDVIQRVEVRP